MPFYNITYSTRNEYSTAVREAVLEFLVFPAKVPGQQIESIHFDFEPAATYYTGENFYGFKFLRFRLKNFKSNFSFTLTARVFKEEQNPYDFAQIALEEELALLNSDDYLIDHYLFLNVSDLTRLPEGYEYPVREEEERTLEFAHRVNQFVHNEFAYDNDVIDPHRKLEETIIEKRGVCQDLAHVMIAILRKNKIPARYVSGYLNQGETVIGAGAVHGWVEVLLPGTGWIGFDPTNNLLEDHHYIKIAHGQDMQDCTTLKGIIKGAGTNQTDYHVLVQEQNKENNQ